MGLESFKSSVAETLVLKSEKLEKFRKLDTRLGEKFPEILP